MESVPPVVFFPGLLGNVFQQFSCKKYLSWKKITKAAGLITPARWFCVIFPVLRTLEGYPFNFSVNVKII